MGNYSGQSAVLGSPVPNQDNPPGSAGHKAGGADQEAPVKSALDAPPLDMGIVYVTQYLCYGQGAIFPSLVAPTGDDPNNYQYYMDLFHLYNKRTYFQTATNSNVPVTQSLTITDTWAQGADPTTSWVTGGTSPWNPGSPVFNSSSYRVSTDYAGLTGTSGTTVTQWGMTDVAYNSNDFAGDTSSVEETRSQEYSWPTALGKMKAKLDTLSFSPIWSAWVTAGAPVDSLFGPESTYKLYNCAVLTDPSDRGIPTSDLDLVSAYPSDMSGQTGWNDTVIPETPGVAGGSIVNNIVSGFANVASTPWDPDTTKTHFTRTQFWTTIPHTFTFVNQYDGYASGHGTSNIWTVYQDSGSSIMALAGSAHIYEVPECDTNYPQAISIANATAFAGPTAYGVDSALTAQFHTMGHLAVYRQLKLALIDTTFTNWASAHGWVVIP